MNLTNRILETLTNRIYSSVVEKRAEFEKSKEFKDKVKEEQKKDEDLKKLVLKAMTARIAYSESVSKVQTLCKEKGYDTWNYTREYNKVEGIKRQFIEAATSRTRKYFNSKFPSRNIVEETIVFESMSGSKELVTDVNKALNL